MTSKKSLTPSALSTNTGSTLRPHIDRRRIEFAVQFAQTDLNVLRYGDWMNLHEDLKEWCGPGPMRQLISQLGWRGAVKEMQKPENQAKGGSSRLQFAGPLLSGEEEDLDDKPIRDLQTRTLEVLEHVVRCRELREGKLTHVPPKPVFMTVAFAIEVWPTTNVLAIHGEWFNQFLCLLMVSLVHEEPNRVLRCPECKRLFVRQRKQRYCGRRCVNAVNTRTWRQKDTNKNLRRDQAHEKYAQAQQRRVGKQVKVARRKQAASRPPESAAD